jgi:hypothetical protein
MRILSSSFVVYSVHNLCLFGNPLLDKSQHARIFNHHASAPRCKRHGKSLRLPLLWSTRSVPKPPSALSSLPNVARDKAWSALLKANDFNWTARYGCAPSLSMNPRSLAWTTSPVTETAVLRSKVALPVGDCIMITQYNIQTILIIQLQPCSRL